VCEAVLRGRDLEADIAAAARAGVDGIAVRTSELLRVGARYATRLLDDAGLRASSVMAIGGAVASGATGPIDAELETLDAAAAIGAPGVLVVTGPRDAFTANEADMRCRIWLERLAPRALDLGVVLLLEPMFPMMRAYSYVHTFEHALDITDAIDGAKLVVDTGHLWWEPELVVLFRTYVDRVGTVQLTNIASDAFDQRRYERAQMDVGEIPLRDLVVSFDAAGYRGWYENEVLTAHPEDRVEFVRRSREWFDAIWQESR
jgi:sugar phosphate isomerase/epimerase